MRSLAAKPCLTEQPSALDESGQVTAAVRPRFSGQSPSNSAAPVLKGQDSGRLATEQSAMDATAAAAIAQAREYQQRLVKLSTALDGAIDDPSAASARELRGTREQSRRE